jgi:hypothetical protein
MAEARQRARITDREDAFEANHIIEIVERRCQAEHTAGRQF